MKKISIIIPSRDQSKQLEFIKRAVESINNQTIANFYNIEILICLDNNSVLDDSFVNLFKVKCIQSSGKSQVAALNAGIRAVDSDYVAFLEDDDQWNQNFLEIAFNALNYSKFVSSTQLEHDENDEIIRINDFPTPSGWFMPIETLIKIGEFNEDYKFHLDNEWLGRLAENEIQRGHLIESTAPKDAKYLNIRPWLLNVINNGGKYSRLLRHGLTIPLIKRLIHSGSGMAQINTNLEYSNISKIEQNKLQIRFGHIPW